MQKNIYDIMLNPARMRIVQAFASRSSMTANEICEVSADFAPLMRAFAEEYRQL